MEKKPKEVTTSKTMSRLFLEKDDEWNSSKTTPVEKAEPVRRVASVKEETYKLNPECDPAEDEVCVTKKPDLTVRTIMSRLFFEKDDEWTCSKSAPAEKAEPVRRAASIKEETYKLNPECDPVKVEACATEKSDPEVKTIMSKVFLEKDNKWTCSKSAPAEKANPREVLASTTDLEVKDDLKGAVVFEPEKIAEETYKLNPVFFTDNKETDVREEMKSKSENTTTDTESMETFQQNPDNFPDSDVKKEHDKISEETYKLNPDSKETEDCEEIVSKTENTTTNVLQILQVENTTEVETSKPNSDDFHVSKEGEIEETYKLNPVFLTDSKKTEGCEEIESKTENTTTNVLQIVQIQDTANVETFKLNDFPECNDADSEGNKSNKSVVTEEPQEQESCDETFLLNPDLLQADEGACHPDSVTVMSGMSDLLFRRSENNSVENGRLSQIFTNTTVVTTNEPEKEEPGKCSAIFGKGKETLEKKIRRFKK